MAFDSKEFFGKIKSGASSAASTVGEMGKAVGKKTGRKGGTGEGQFQKARPGEGN